MKNHILEELWHNRDEFAREHNYDINAIVATLRETERQSPNQIIDRRSQNSQKTSDHEQTQDKP
jgi:ribonuclease D